MRALWLVGASLFGGATYGAQDVKPWEVRAEGGSAEIHQTSNDGPAVAIRVARVSRKAVFRVDTGLVLSRAGDGFSVVDFGAEFRLCGVKCSVAPYVGGGVGLLSEPEFNGEMFRAGGGIEVRLGADNSVRLGVQAGTHGGERGPHLVYVGFAHRWGSRK